MLISLPNIAIWNVRFELLFGRFEYQDTGTLDRTHMRFFTRRSLRRFLERGRPGSPGQPHHSWHSPALCPADQAHLRPDRAPGPEASGDSSSIMDSAPYRFYLQWLYPIERAICRLWPGLLAFQFVTWPSRLHPARVIGWGRSVAALSAAVETRTEHVHGRPSGAAMISVAMITMNEEKAVARVIEDIRDGPAARDRTKLSSSTAVATPRPPSPPG